MIQHIFCCSNNQLGNLLQFSLLGIILFRRNFQNYLQVTPPVQRGSNSETISTAYSYFQPISNRYAFKSSGVIMSLPPDSYLNIACAYSLVKMKHEELSVIWDFMLEKKFQLLFIGNALFCMGNCNTFKSIAWLMNWLLATMKELNFGFPLFWCVDCGSIEILLSCFCPNILFDYMHSYQIFLFLLGLISTLPENESPRNFFGYFVSTFILIANSIRLLQKIYQILQGVNMSQGNMSLTSIVTYFLAASYSTLLAYLAQSFDFTIFSLWWSSFSIFNRPELVSLRFALLLMFSLFYYSSLRKFY